ncbi:GNAT family N-acetyltransferase [Acetanaerobacterium elongatum]|uniref:Ribosomal protein S18 acetylase RimI n=1 Tax=Acetanaerobacterium elongatum TaxID=258515 RepID=A0A1H0GBS2_9FIRM|nr:GNAT family N-acetyltransferase [Acetanaerobacterium elongatum]SDO04281.1 Ribosomal protein S18 acetylase RimI [Acetanaerobacterium elongatum]
MEYRKATLQDIDELVDIRIAMRNERENVKEIDIVQFRENTRAYFQTGMTDNSYISWVAVENSNIVSISGMCFYRIPPTYANITGLVAYVMSVYTKPEFRRRGIAQALFEHLLAEAENRGCTVITLNASPMGRSLYEKYGFTANNQAKKLHL